MNVVELIEKLTDIETSEGVLCPDVYIRIGLHQVKVNKIDFIPETDYEEEAIIIS